MHWRARRRRLLTIKRRLIQESEVPPACWYCGQSLDDPQFRTIDHLTPRAAGGQDLQSNCVLSCHRCNHRKADHPHLFGLAVFPQRGRGLWSPAHLANLNRKAARRIAHERRRTAAFACCRD